MSADAGSLRIRPMGAADLDCVTEIAKSLRQAPQWQRGAYEAALDAGAGVRRLALVAEDAAGAVVGFLVASVTPPEAELETLAVTAEEQGRGVAKALLAGLAEALRREGVRETLLEVRASNRGALALYGRLGFAEAGRRRAYYANPPEDAVVMRRTMD
ncbi:MAG TPA: ribosomal protein S18-alanine N-acetyltransferase [Terracidiphilus sp.]|nr:ribosomal protein S18-alanine N-acetyltransferase [Terracidiphilus sp.]